MTQPPDALRYILWRYGQDHRGEDHQARLAAVQAWLATLPLDAEAAPIEDIERLLRSYDGAPKGHPGYTRDARLLVRRVQRWLDSLPREAKVKE